MSAATNKVAWLANFQREHADEREYRLWYQRYVKAKYACPTCGEEISAQDWGYHQESAHDNGDLTDVVAIEALQLDGGTQSRAALNEVTIQDYEDAMLAGAQFPKIDVYFDGECHWLADGYHRVYAWARLGYEFVPATIHQGTQRDAILHSVGANASHGLQRTNEDKRRAVMRLLTDEEWSQWSDREIARRCGVSDRLVNKLRKELFPSANGSQIARTVERGGTVYTMNTASIGTSTNGHTPTPEPGEDNLPTFPQFQPYDRVMTRGLGPGTVISQADGVVTVMTDDDGLKRSHHAVDLRLLGIDEEPPLATETEIRELLAAGDALESAVETEAEDVDQPAVETPAVSQNYKRDQKSNRAGNAYEPQGYDACQTPPYALDPLLPYISREWKVWEPAAGEGLMVEGLYDSGFNDVTASDLLTGQNFFDWQPEQAWDCIITNPPYSLKFEWLERCYELGKPFALLVPVEMLGAGTAQALIRQHGFEMLLLSRRVDFKMPRAGWNSTGSQFPTFWLCWQILPATVVFGEISLEAKREFHDAQ